MEKETTPELVLRPATEADIPALSKLATEAFIAKFGFLYSEKDLNDFLSEAMSEPAIARELADPDRTYRLAERDGKLVGYCKMAMTPGWPDYVRSDRTIELKQLYTDPSLTGGGIGKALMEWAMDFAAGVGAKEMHLSVWSGNEGAHRFYERWGFSKLADITFRVGEQLDEEFLFARMLD